VFTGNSDGSSPVAAILQRALKGVRAIRIQPTVAGPMGVALRLEVIGCVEERANEGPALTYMGTPRVLEVSGKAGTITLEVRTNVAADVYALAVPSALAFLAPSAEQIVTRTNAVGIAQTAFGSAASTGMGPAKLVITNAVPSTSYTVYVAAFSLGKQEVAEGVVTLQADVPASTTCGAALGVATGGIPDGAFSASSFDAGAGAAPWCARLPFNKAGRSAKCGDVWGWAPHPS
jgi:hypothetical protein